MSPQHKRRLLGLALAATVLAAYLAPPEATSEVLLTPQAQRVAVGTTAAAPGLSHPQRLALRTLLPREPWESEVDLFEPDEETRSRSEAMLPVATAQPPAPEPAAIQPAPPPLRMIGRYVEDGQTAAFVQFNEQNLVLRAGDRVGDVYQVERVEEGGMTVRHLATDQEQTVTLQASP